MALRDLVLFALIFGMVPICLARPFVGLLVYSWLGYMNVHRLTWGMAFDFPFAQVVALVTLVGFVGMIIREGKWRRLPMERETILLLLLWAMFTLTTFTALIPEEAWADWQDLTKIFLISFLTIILVDDEKKLRYLVLVIALSLGFYGFKGGLFAIAKGGRYMVFGPERSFIEDNTAIGLALVMVLPFLFYLAKAEHNWWFKRSLELTSGLTTLAILFTYSRGAVLGLAAVLGVIFLGLNRRTKAVAILFLVLSLPIAISQLPDRWLSRMETIQAYQEEGSAMKRIMAWKTAWRVALAHPLTGAGAGIIDAPEIAASYHPEFTERDVGVHSIYFEVLAENGFITFGLFVFLLLSSFASLQKVKRISRQHGLPRFHYYAQMLQASLAGYAVSGAFLEFASFDLFYHIVALAIILKVLSRQHTLALGKHAETAMVEKITPERLT
jgi:probable O-glycosylation ligase (exosortase A-associated)